MDRRERILNSIYKNIGEIADLCLDYDIHSAYDIMDVIYRYGEIIEYLEIQNKSANLRGIHDRVLKEICEIEVE